MKELIISQNPHVKSKCTTKRIMLDVVIALLPAAVLGCIYFGLSALWTILIAVAAAVATEYVYALLAKQGWKEFVAWNKSFWKAFDFTSVVTGLLLAMVLPATPENEIFKWYIPLLGSIFAIAAVKMLFGGTGKNFVNPALAGRIFLFISFTAVTVYPACGIAPLFGGEETLTTGATQLGNLLNGTATLSPLDLLLGTGVAGCIGETCKLALLLGGLYLVIRGVITWWYPVVYIAVTGLFTVALNGFDFNLFLPSILSGGLILGAIFMATDYVTSPKSKLGNLIYYIALGLLTAGLRQATGVEVVSFCILLMNIVVPLIDGFIPVRPFGYKKEKKAKEAK